MSLLEKLVVDEITEQDFLRTYPVDLTKNKSYLIDLSEEASKQKDEDTLSLLLDVIATLEIYRGVDLQSIYRKLIQEDWHKMHEELVDSLDKSERNEGTFISVLNTTYAYHSHGVEDFMVPIWSKCLWNLYAIRSERAINTIRAYSQSEYEYLRETAQKLILKLNNE